jgi:hypothetical protein
MQRHILFLDLFYWIKLSESREPVYQDLNKALHEAVEEGYLICPISPSIFMELKKQPASEERKNHAQLMDKLSRKLSLRISQNIFKDEFRAVMAAEQIPRNIAHSHYLDAPSRLNLKFPKHGWDSTMIEEGTKLIFDEIEALPIDQSLSMTEKNRSQYIDSLRNGWRQLADQEAVWRVANPDATLKEIEGAEFASTVQAFVPYLAPDLLNIITKADLSIKLKYLSMREGERQEMVINWLNDCPTFWNKYKVIVALRSNKQRLEENDLWDLEHIVSAVPYVDCLTCDKGMRHRLTQMLSLDKKYGVKIVSKPDQVLMWVRNIRSA